jgi:hypothetical protein
MDFAQRTKGQVGRHAPAQIAQTLETPVLPNAADSILDDGACSQEESHRPEGQALQNVLDETHGEVKEVLEDPALCSSLFV